MSSGMLFVLCKGLLGFGLPLAFGFWQLHDLRRERLKDEAKAAAGAGECGSPPILHVKSAQP
jgi:hypothetical protein